MKKRFDIWGVFPRVAAQTSNSPLPVPFIRAAAMAGMSLVEVVVAIVVISIALSGLLSAINNMMLQSTDPVVEQQGVLLTQSYLQDLLMRDYDAVCSSLLGTSGCSGSCNPCIVTWTSLLSGAEQYNPSIQQLQNYRFTLSLNIYDSGFDVIPSDYGRKVTATVQHLRLGGLTLSQNVQNIATLTMFQARHKPIGT